jgi:hypothetical protein
MSPNNEQSQSQSQSQSQQRRPEMRGPSDISNILSGLKTKTIDIKESPVNDFENNDNSTISISDLKDLQDNGINLPKKSKRRQKSDKNTVSLDF